MKKFLSVFLIFALSVSFFSFVSFAQENDEIYFYENYSGDKVYYYKDVNGEPYIIEDGKKCYIAVPEYIEKVTDEELISQFRSDFNSSVNSNAYSANSDLLFSIRVYFNPLVKTGILNISDNYVYLKCSDLAPSNANRGFSYWILFSPDGKEWLRAYFANYSLTFYTRHRMADLGNASSIQIHIFSCDGSVSSCILSVKQGGVLG